MDGIQSLLLNKKSLIIESINSQDDLNTVLNKLIPDSILHKNLLLCAYRDKIREKIQQSDDASLSSLQMIQSLVETQGVSKRNAHWAVQTWCYIFGYDTLANALAVFEGIGFENTQNSTKLCELQEKEYKLRSGVYKPGIDFPAGEICVINTSETPLPFGLSWGIGKNPGKIRADADSHFFQDRVYLVVNEDEYLKIDGRNDSTVIVRKV